MSRIFSGDPNFGTLTSAVGGISAVPLSMSVWYKATSSSPTQGEEILVQIGRDATDIHSFTLGMFSGSPYFATNDGGGFAGAICSGVVADTNWHHVCGHTGGTATRSVYLDGASKTTNTTAATPTAINETRVGNRDTGGVSTLATLAHVAIWNAALSDSDVTNLAAGVSPLAVKPANLKFYLPHMGRDATTDQSITDGNVVTYAGTGKSTNEPAIPVGNTVLPYYASIIKGR